MQRRSFLNLALGASAAGWLQPSLAAGDYPARPMRWVVPYPAGGGSDFSARVLSQPLSQAVGQPVVVENKSGGNGAIAVADVLRSAADGYSLINVDNGILVFNPLLYKSLGYAPDDLELVSVMTRSPMMLIVGPASPGATAREYIDVVKAAPGKYSFGSAGAGTPQHMGMELFMHQAGLKMTHVPYRGSTPALTDLLGGQIPSIVGDFTSASAFIRAGKLRVLAVASEKRHPDLPDVPTFREIGLPDCIAASFVGVAVKKSTPPAIIDKVQDLLANAARLPEVKSRFAEVGQQPIASTPSDFRALVQSERTRWQRLVQEAGISLS